MTAATPTVRRISTLTASDLPSLALFPVTLAAGVSLSRLFKGSGPLLGVVAAALIAHTLTWWTRRRAIGSLESWGIAVGALVLLATWVVLPHTTFFGIPTSATFATMVRELGAAYRDFGQVVAPTDPTVGFRLAVMLGIGFSGVLADWAAFRTGGTLEALIPAFSAFVFAATLGDDQGRMFFTAAFLAAVLAYLLTQHAAASSTAASWFASRTAGGVPALINSGVAVGAAVMVLAVVVGPLLPGSRSTPIVGIRDRDGSNSGGRTTISPLIDIRGRLTDRSDAVVFSVRSPVRAYWRLMSLDRFDGSIWSASGSYLPVDERLPGIGNIAPPAEAIDQDFTISGLSSIWLPAAYQPQRVDGIDNARYDARSGSLISDEATSDGLEYRVRSALPRLTPEVLGGQPNPAGPPGEPRRYLELPETARSVAGLAFQVVGRQTTPYGRAIALQNFFRDNFTYDLGAVQGHDSGALENFLFTSRRGYCEQFAGAFAVMARLMGLPTRVAVGFTPGEQDVNGVFEVRALNAHAWPEVWLGSAGWVAFEPTPGRGMPGAEPYTGVPEAQASVENPTTATTGAPAPATTAAPTDGAATATTLRNEVGAGEDATAPAAPGRRSPLLTALGLLLALGAIWVAAIPGLAALQRRRRLGRAATKGDAAVIEAAWVDAESRLTLVGVTRGPGETVKELALRVGRNKFLDAEASEALTRVAGAATSSMFGGTAGPEVAEKAREDANVVRRAAAQTAGRWAVFTASVDPRRLGRTTAGHEVRTRPSRAA